VNTKHPRFSAFIFGEVTGEHGKAFLHARLFYLQTDPQMDYL